MKFYRRTAVCHSMRRFSPPWTVEQIPGGYKMLDADGQSLVYVYGRETKADADLGRVLIKASAVTGCPH